MNRQLKTALLIIFLVVSFLVTISKLTSAYFSDQASVENNSFSTSEDF